MGTHDQHLKLIIRGAVTGLMGFVLSGPVAVIIVTWLNPQPPWVNAALFVDAYHPVQNLPYYLGFLLLAGMLMFSAGHYLSFADASSGIRTNLLLSLALTSVFTALIAFNYICQTTFVHNLALHYRPEYESLIAGFSMANPASFCWANEMWGYGILGLATWLLAPYYKGKSSFIRWLLIANGIVSLASPLWSVFDVNWVMTPVGFILYLLWNLLMIVMMIAIIRFTSAQAEKNNL
ncbi:MAG: hypothetical protein IPL92_15970 [Saprospiraceae bacterium]|nr:hypothetical protein [Candidatus Opimibacter iunctus]